MKARTILSLLTLIATLQLGLLWVQGAQLYRQQQTLQALRQDVQDLTDVLEGGSQGGDEGTYAPGRLMPRGHARLRAAHHLRIQEEDPAAKELRASRESAEKAVKEAREVQKKLSVEEAAKRAELDRQQKAAQDQWVTWAWGALGLVVVALLVRGWLRRR